MPFKDTIMLAVLLFAKKLDKLTMLLLLLLLT